MKAWWLAFWACAAVSGLGAALVFEQERLDRTAEPGQTEVEAVFSFRNPGPQTVEVLEVKASCGCTAAALEKRLYAPGESGAIHATFHTAGKTGPNTVTVNVTTNDPTQPNQTLFLFVNVPTLLEIQPRILRWAAGAPAVERAFELRPGGAGPVKVTGVEVTPADNFAGRIEELPEGGGWRVWVTPKSTAVAARGPQPAGAAAPISATTARIRFLTEPEPPPGQTAEAYLVIR